MGPVTDESELEDVRRAVEAADSVFTAGAHRISKDGRTLGFEVRTGADLTRGGPNTALERSARETLGQARRVLRVRCKRCDRVVAELRHVTGPGFLSREDWAQARAARGEVGPWRGWLIERRTGRAWRDYWTGAVDVSCDCGRNSIRVSLGRALAVLTSGRTGTDTLTA